jgi:tRNA G26 N,N-dimethylase Trm1
MNVIVLKTNIQTKKKVKSLIPAFNNHAGIKRWNVDTEDVDKVLRVEADQSLQEIEIIQLIHSHGFSCEELEG